MADSRFCSDLNPIIFLTTIIKKKKKKKKKYGERVLEGYDSPVLQPLPAPPQMALGSPIKINIYIIYLFIAMYTNGSWTDTKQVNCSPHLPFNTSHPMAAIHIKACRRRQRTRRV